MISIGFAITKDALPSCFGAYCYTYVCVYLPQLIRMLYRNAVTVTIIVSCFTASRMSANINDVTYKFHVNKAIFYSAMILLNIKRGRWQTV